MRLLNVDTLEGAREKLLQAAASKVPETEILPFEDCLGKILAEDLTSRDSIPGFRKSTVDGYAVIAQNTQGVTESIPVFLDVVEEVAIGTQPQKTLQPGQAIYVPTGGMLPEGADAMVMVEYCEKFDDTSIAVYNAVSPGRNVIAEGEDIMAGAGFLKKGKQIRAQEVGVMASAGVTEAKVYKPWKITIISTGDELVDASETPEKAQTRDINTYSVSAISRNHGFEIIDRKVLKDDKELLRKTITDAMAASDVVVCSGGSSQGEKDHTADVMDQLSHEGVFTHGVALKPGKPTILGFDQETGTILVGLPGHPAAAMMVFELFVIWLYRQLTGQKEPAKTLARITENVAAGAGRTTCLMLELAEGDDGIYRAVPVLGKSGLMTTLTRADGYTLIHGDTEGLKEGELIQVTLF